MHRPFSPTFARFVAVPENRSALAAVQHLAAYLCSRRDHRGINPLYLHGPAGTGKSYLVSALVEEVTRRCPDMVVSVLAAGDWKAALEHAESLPGEESSLRNAAEGCALWIVEDLQHLDAAVFETLVQIFDGRLACGNPMVFTAVAGPRQLHLSARLASRLASGLVVGLEPLQAGSRLALLQDRAQRRQLVVGRDVLAWLAEHLTGGRQLEGALGTLEMLARLHGRTPDVAMVASHFQEQAEAGRPTVERIMQRVGGCFHIEPRQLQSGQRARHVLLPRQVGMYLVRQLTPLSLAQIGAYFGGRDHSTVLHACRKVEQALVENAALSGTVRRLQSELA